MTISHRTAAILALVETVLAILATLATALATTGPDPLPARQQVVRDSPVRVGPTVNLTPDDPGVMRDDPTVRPTTPPPVVVPPVVDPSTPTEPTRPVTPERRRVMRPNPTDGSAPPTSAPEEYEPVGSYVPLPPIRTESPAPTT